MDIPDDLIDLRTVAKRLRRQPRHLRELSLKKQFPPIHKIGERCFMVRESEVEAWWRECDLEQVECVSTLRAEWVDAEHRKLRGP